MIKNERQYAVTRSRVRKFEAAIADMDLELACGADRIQMAERTGLQSKTDKMKRDIAEYEALRSGMVPHVDAGNLEDLPEELIKMRIGLGLTQRELAERMGIREQQVQRYEQTDYESASYARLMEAHAALSPGTARGTGCEDVPNDAHVLSRIKIAGLGGRFVDDCIVGRPRARGGGRAEAATYERRLLSRLQRIYGWSPSRLLGSAPLDMGPATARFKLPAGADHAVVNAHAVYAGYVADVLARASGGGGERRRPLVQGDPYRLRRELGGGGDGTITFPGLVEYAWKAGVAVGHLPPLAFHAAYFNRGGMGVVMLARGEASESRLMFDLAHEMYHAGKGLDRIDADESDTSEEELAANRFAHAVLVGPGADRMFRACMERCASGADAWDLAMLKRAVSEAALEEGVRADSLANYVAYRLAGESICNWWGTAQTMQKKMPEWRDTVSSAIGSHADILGMSNADFDLLSDVMGVRHQ